MVCMSAAAASLIIFSCGARVQCGALCILYFYSKLNAAVHVCPFKTVITGCAACFILKLCILISECAHVSSMILGIYDICCLEG